MQRQEMDSAGTAANNVAAPPTDKSIVSHWTARGKDMVRHKLAYNHGWREAHHVPQSGRELQLLVLCKRRIQAKNRQQEHYAEHVEISLHLSYNIEGLALFQLAPAGKPRKSAFKPCFTPFESDLMPLRSEWATAFAGRDERVQHGARSVALLAGFWSPRAHFLDSISARTESS
eukprot:1101441-Prymnesium_polylepis.1